MSLSPTQGEEVDKFKITEHILGGKKIFVVAAESLSISEYFYTRFYDVYPARCMRISRITEPLEGISSVSGGLLLEPYSKADNPRLEDIEDQLHRLLELQDDELEA